jgi:hypothetical protein
MMLLLAMAPASSKSLQILASSMAMAILHSLWCRAARAGIGVKRTICGMLHLVCDLALRRRRRRIMAADSKQATSSTLPRRRRWRS